MSKVHRFSTKKYLTRAVFTLSLAFAAPVMGVDWNAVEGKEITLFFPGQRSWESLLTQGDHPGAKQFRKGKNCRECHQGEEKSMGKDIVSGKKKALESEPIQGMRAWIPLSVKTVHDGKRLYVRLEWPSTTQTIGRKLDPESEAKATLMLGDGRTAEALRGGCWGACHDDMVGMPSADAGKLITKYLVASRIKVTRQGGGENYQPAGKLAELLKKGAFYEYWQAKLSRGSEAKASDGFILDKHSENATPLVQVESGFGDGKWSAVFSRDLKVGAAGHKDLLPGSTYFIGFAVHDAFAARRYHHVSLEHTLILDDGKADFVVKKQ